MGARRTGLLLPAQEQPFPATIRGRAAAVSSLARARQVISTDQNRGTNVAHSPRGWTGTRTPSAIKRVRQAERRAEINRPRQTKAKTLVAKSLTVATGQLEGDPAVALAEAYSALDMAAKAGAIHPNAAARRKSRLARKVGAALGGQAVQTTGRVTKTTGKAAATKAAKARVAAGKAEKAKGAQTAAGKARAALAKAGRAEATPAAAAATEQAAAKPAPRTRTRKAAEPAATAPTAEKKPATRTTAAKTTTAAKAAAEKKPAAKTATKAAADKPAAKRAPAKKPAE